MQKQDHKMMKATLNHIDLGLYTDEVDQLVSYQKITKSEKVNTSNKMMSKKRNTQRIDKRSMISDNW